jgi:hypothetical protein
MADFHQTGVITTLHRLGPGDLTRLERELYLHGCCLVSTRSFETWRSRESSMR